MVRRSQCLLRIWYWGLYYITKLRKGAKGEGLIFYGPEEALIAYNEGKVDIHAIVSVVAKDLDENGNIVDKMLRETSVGRVIVNEIVPAECGYINTIISKKSLRDIISDVIKTVGVARACEFLWNQKPGLQDGLRRRSVLQLG